MLGKQKQQQQQQQQNKTKQKPASCEIPREIKTVKNWTQHLPFGDF